MKARNEERLIQQIAVLQDAQSAMVRRKRLLERAADLLSVLSFADERTVTANGYKALQLANDITEELDRG